MQILSPLLNLDGFRLTHTGDVRDNGVDILSENGYSKIAINYKHYKNNKIVATKDVRELMGATLVGKFERAILLTSSSFSRQARQEVSQFYPIAVQLVDLNDLKKWVSKVEANFDETEVVIVLRNFTQQIIELINKNPRTLDELEWRDMERVIAEVFKGIGFTVELTPASQDGGKDVILECISNGTKKTYIIEVKHWRSAQKVGKESVKDFIKVITREKRAGGLFLSTYGFTENAAESITEIERQKVRFGQEEKIISLCKTYPKRRTGIWQEEKDLHNLLYSNTV